MKNFKTNIFKAVFASAALLSFSSCVDDKFDLPPIVCTDKFSTTNATIADLAALGTSNPTEVVAQDMIVEGYVNSSDKEGNIFKTIIIQDQAVNPSIAFQMDVDQTGNYANFPVGSKVRVNVKGLLVQKNKGVLKVGSPDPQYPIGRIAPIYIANHIARSCESNTQAEIREIKPVEFSDIAEALKIENVNKLIKIKSVQFVSGELNKNFTDAKDTSGSNRSLEDKNGNTIILRNSVYASFAKTAISPEYGGSGDVTAVLSNYNGTYQLLITSLSDLDLKKPRFVTGILGGENIVYKSTLTENFESFATGNLNTPAYLNYAESGNPKRYWEVREFAGNHYIQMSAFRASSAIKTYYIVPVKLTGASKLSFETKDGYYNGDALKVYYSTKYQAGAELKAADITDITSKFTISKNSSGYARKWVASGSYTIPATGNGFVIFEYSGSPSVTTTYQIDNVEVK